ncbi:MAG: hypothetical protein ACT4QA_09690 [Panacagrimonas sp.]
MSALVARDMASVDWIERIDIARRASLAPCKLRHFEGLPTPVISPWNG